MGPLVQARGLSNWEGPLALAGAFLAVALACLGVLRFSRHRRSWRAHYLRLSRTRPDANCPCGSATPYEGCCRADDIERLREDIRQHLLRDWGHRTFHGRYKPEQLDQRLAKLPNLEQIGLPEWVDFPGRFEFPIPEETLRNWRPRARGPGTVG